MAVVALPMVWAQTAPDPDAVPLLALRRWCSSLTLSSPEAVPGSFPVGVWLGGVALLVLLAVVAQGPIRALGQFFDLPGHAHLLAAALRRLRRAGRLVAVTLGATVLAWTASQFAAYGQPERLEDLAVLSRTKSVGELAFEHGVLAGLTPVRDVFGLGDTLVLLAAATVLVFRLSADRWGNYDALAPEPEPAPAGTSLSWAAAGLYALYRLTSIILTEQTGGLPLGGCLVVEAALIPGLMALCDGLLLAWVLVELREADRGDGDAGIDVRGAVALVPAATLACLLALPARYVAPAAWLALQHAPGLAAKQVLAYFVRDWGPAVLQGGSLALVGLAGVVAWGRGTAAGALRGYGRLLRAEGGHLAAAVALGSLAAGAAAALAYMLVLSLPAQPWVLATADGYAHYATLPIGLVLTSALLELGRRAPRPPAPGETDPVMEIRAPEAAAGPRTGPS